MDEQGRLLYCVAVSSEFFPFKLTNLLALMGWADATY